MTPCNRTPQALLTAFLLATTIHTAAARAEPGPVSTWLMNKPLTLFDWGMYRVGKSMDRVATRLKEIYPEGWFFPYETYSWDHDEIHFSWRVIFDPDDWRPTDDPGDWPATHDNCNYFRKLILRSVLWLLIDPEEIENDSMNLDLKPEAGGWDPRTRVGGVLDKWFAHTGESSYGIPYFERTDRPEDLGEKLARIVWLSVVLQDESRDRIECKARITDWEAPSRPV